MRIQLVALCPGIDSGPTTPRYEYLEAKVAENYHTIGFPYSLQKDCWCLGIGSGPTTPCSECLEAEVREGCYAFGHLCYYPTGLLVPWY